MNIYDKILQLCVSTDELRPTLSKPCRRNGKIMATNGHVLVFIDENLPEGEYGDNEYCNICEAWRNPETKKLIGGDEKVCNHEGSPVSKFPQRAETIFTSALAEASLNGESKTFGLAELNDTLSVHEKKPIYETMLCSNCNNGKISCAHCGYDGTCWVCSGNGKIKTGKIAGYQFNDDAEIKIGETFFSAFYASGVLGEIMRLTGSDAILVAQSGYNDQGGIRHPSVFRIGDVDFILMPTATTNDNIGALAKGAVIEFRKS